MTEAATRQILMSDMFTADNNVNTRRFKVSTVTRSEIQIAEGDYFVGKSERFNIGTGETYYAVIKAPADKYLSIEDVEVAPDFANTQSGKFNIRIDAFVDISNASTWSYTGGTQLPAGRPLNASMINNVNPANIVLDVNATLVPANPSLPGSEIDYPLIAIDHFLESQGARESISQTGINFFRNNRFVLLAPNQELLVRTITEGGASGTVDLDTMFFMSTVDANLIQG